MTTTNLSRRRFFALLGGAAATHFLPPIGGWKSDVIVSPPDAVVWITNGVSMTWKAGEPFPIAVKMIQDAYAMTLEHPQYLYWSEVSVKEPREIYELQNFTT